MPQPDSANTADDRTGRIVIVGAGQSGARCAEALRAAGCARPVTLIGEETHLPYERPSLSKETLFGRSQDEGVTWVKSREQFARDGIELRLGVGVSRIDRQHRRVHLRDGASLPYDTLILTTGARPRVLSAGSGSPSPLQVLRTLDDSRRLRQALSGARRLLVVGGGLIGLEVAAGARQAGIEVTVLQASQHLLARCVPAVIGDFYAELHRERGVEIAFDAQVTSMRRDGQISLHCVDGRRFSADAAVLAIGVEPNSELAREAGLATGQGILVDQYGRTSDPHIYAAGDVACHYNPLLCRHIQLESWQNAQNQAIAVARVVAGGSQPYAEIPWFWSDQFGWNLQVAGLPQADAHSILRGELGRGTGMVFQVARGRIVCACALNAPRELRAAKELIAAQVPVDEQALGNPNVKLMDLVRAMKQQQISA